MNWTDLINDLLNAGMHQDKIAERIGCSQSHVSDLANSKRGKRMSFELGQKILDLHKEIFEREAA